MVRTQGIGRILTQKSHDQNCTVLAGISKDFEVYLSLTKYSRKKYSAIASLRILVYIEFRAKVYGERGKYTVRSHQFSGEHGWGRR